MSRCWGSARRTAQEGQRAEGSLGREVGAGLPAVAEATHGSSAAIAAAGGRNQPGLGGSDEATHRDAASVEQDSGRGCVRGAGTAFRDRSESGGVCQRGTVCLLGGGLSGQSGIGGRQL